MIWPVIAPVNSIWCRNSRELKEPVFEKLFNMVSGMSSSQQNSFANGTGFAVVNDRGELMGICLTVSTQMNVKHIESSSVAGLGKKIAEAVRNPIRRKLPLTADDCPVDLALADDDYRNWIKLESDGNHDEARECMLKVISRYPASALVLANALISPCYKEGDFTEADLPVVAQGDSDPVRHSKHQIRSRYWMQMLEREKAIEELEKAVEASPPDAIQVRMSLAAQYADDEEWEKAEKICRDMHRQSWGSIAFVEFFESVLTHLRKWEEVDACAERIIELGEMGRLQRGGGERELRERHETLRRIHGADDPVTVEADKHLTEFLRVKARMANPDDHGKNDP
jgi:tetratricopeptide (TPR) repeat protein